MRWSGELGVNPFANDGASYFLRVDNELEVREMSSIARNVDGVGGVVDAGT